MTTEIYLSRKHRGLGPGRRSVTITARDGEWTRFTDCRGVPHRMATPDVKVIKQEAK